MDKIESLLISKKIPGAQRWQPTRVAVFERVLSSGIFVNMRSEIRKNISYSLQYLQFLQLQIKELNITSVLFSQLCKSYVIVSCSIIECIFHYLLQIKNYYKKEEWEDLVGKKYSTSFDYNGDNLRYQIITQKKVKEPHDSVMDFNEMINKIEHKEVLSLTHDTFPFLRELRRLRNRVHLQAIDGFADTDYFLFSKRDVLIAGRILYRILADSNISLNEDDLLNFKWLKFNK